MEKFKEWLWKNRIVGLYFIFSVMTEIMSVFSVEKYPFITSPFIGLGILLFICGIVSCINSNVIKSIILSVCLIFQAVLDIGFAIVYDMTGQYFDFGMLNLRNDAFGILESVTVNFVTFYASVFFCISYVIFARRIISKEKKMVNNRLQKNICRGVAVFGIAMTLFTVYLNNSILVDKYDKMLNSKQDSNYRNYGIVGNLVNEFGKGIFFNKEKKISSKKIDSFIYKEVSKPTDYFGVSKDNNVIVILTESFEWFSFINNSDEYPYGLNLSDEVREKLFPNLYKFYNESVVMDNFHSKEKTDISETLSIMGSYPSNAYVDYDYPENTIPTTVPNILRELYGDKISINSFHDGYKTFYNRNITHKTFGFSKFSSMSDMFNISDSLVKSGKADKPTMNDYASTGERNLDSEMINTCKDKMFVTDKRFYTYITTITSHGIYYERKNLAQNRKMILKYYKPHAQNEEMEGILIDYMSTIMDFDKALGIMMDDLESKGLLDKTTIVIFGDHNSYYQELSGYVKDLEDYTTDRNYTDLYKVPLMIYDKNLGHKVIGKFTCTSDIVPTITDLLGINTYSNLYYGNSVLSDEESVLYSRAYGFFVGDGVLARSMNNILFKSNKVPEDYMSDFKIRSKSLVKKIKYCDQIFYQNYFADKTHYEKYIDKMQEIDH